MCDEPKITKRIKIRVLPVSEITRIDFFILKLWPTVKPRIIININGIFSLILNFCYYK